MIKGEAFSHAGFISFYWGHCSDEASINKISLEKRQKKVLLVKILGEVKSSALSNQCYEMGDNLNAGYFDRILLAT